MTKKKKIIISTAAAVAVLAVLIISAVVAVTVIAKKNSIMPESAVEIALADAGVSRESATLIKSRMDFDDGIFVYDVEFRTETANEYDYKIKAADGTVLERSHEVDDDLIRFNSATTPKTSVQAETPDNQETSTTQPAQPTQPAGANQEAQISLDKAKEIALKHAGLSSENVTFTKAQLEYDDGINNYEIDFTFGDFEYDYKINPVTGDIADFDKDSIYS